MISYPHCPVCHSKDLEQVLEAKDYTVSSELFKISHCKSCTFRFTNPVPAEQEIGRYYQSEDYVSHSDTSKGLINSLYQRVRRRTLRSKRKLVVRFSGKPSGNLLDIGCGTGAFLGEMKNAGWTVTGLEPDAGARAIALEKHGVNALPSSDLMGLKDGEYDVITLWHVLEHVHELDAYMAKIQALLKKGGKLIIAVPNYDSVDAKVYGAGWAAYDVPRHLYHFTPAAMAKLLSRTGFTLSGMKKMPFDSFYVSMLSEKYRKGSLIRAGWVGFRSWMVSLGNTARCSSVIYLSGK